MLSGASSAFWQWAAPQDAGTSGPGGGAQAAAAPEPTPSLPTPCGSSPSPPAKPPAPAPSPHSPTSAWLHAVRARASHTVYAVAGRIARWSDDADSCRWEGQRGCGPPPLLPPAAARWVQATYAALPTTRLSTWALPCDRDAPLVLHITLILLSLEAAQAASFYVRYRRAMRASAAAMAAALAEEAAQDEEEADAEAAVDGGETAEDAEHDGDAEAPTELSSSTVHPISAAVSPTGMESATGRDGARPRVLPRGSSRALHRISTYWALVERAVRAAPRKRPGAPTSAAELGGFFRTDFPGASADDAEPRAFGKFTSDGVPHGAETVLVVPDVAAFPVMTRPGEPSPLPSPPPAPAHGDVSINPSLNSTVDAVSLTAEAPEVAEPWGVLHLLWTDTVRYSVTYAELRQLLLGCTVAEIAKLFEDAEDGENGGSGGMGGIGGMWNGFYSARGPRVLQTIWRSMSSRNVSAEALAHTARSTVDSPLYPSAAASFSARCVASPNSPASATASQRRYADPRVAVACLALTWYLALVREVYEAVIVHEDVQRCADALEELKEYNRAVYQHGIEVGDAFFEEALHSASYSGASARQHEGSSHSRSSAGVPPRASSGALDQLHLRDASHNHRRLLELPDVVSTAEVDDLPSPAGGGATTAAASPAAAMPPRLSSYEGRGGNPLGEDAAGEGDGEGPLSSPSSPHRPDSCETFSRSVAVTLTRVRGAAPRACWAELSAALAALLRRRRLMELSHVRSLFSYMYTGSVAKMVSFVVLAGLTSVSSRVAAVGLSAREAISGNLDAYYRAHPEDGGGCRGGGAPSAPSGDEGGVPAQQRILALCALECMRLAINTVLTQTRQEYIAVAASQRRNTVKAELYEALTRLPLAFFDLHSYDEVEQIVYYVNDIEGVEVHVHQYVCSLISTLLAMQHAMHQLPRRARLLVGATVALSLGVKYVGRRVKLWTQAAQRTGGVLPPWLRGYNLDGTVSATAELDAQVEENTESNARQGGVMLRGLDIVAVLPQLRPYAADLSLMHWWTDHTRACGAAVGATEATSFAQGLLVLPLQAYGKLLPALGGALVTFGDWVLPTLVASYGASMAYSGSDALSLSNRLIEAMRCVGDTVDAVVDGRRVAEVVLLNAYKANVLEKVLDPRRWEPTTSDFARGFILGTTDEDELNDAVQATAASASGGGGGGCGSGTAAHVDGLPRVAEADAVSQHRRQRLLRSFCRADPRAVTCGGAGAAAGAKGASSSPSSVAVACWRLVRDGAVWAAMHAPPVLVFRGGLWLTRRALARLRRLRHRGSGGGSGDVAHRRHHHRRATRALYRHHRRRRETARARRAQQSGSAQSSPVQATPGGGEPITPRHRPLLARESISEATEAYHSDAPSDEARDVSAMSRATPSPSRTSASSTSTSASDDDSDVDSETAAAAAAAVLTSATVHAVEVRNLQFYYPTAPTVPVFPRPITCSFTLQHPRGGGGPSAKSGSNATDNPAAGAAAPRELHDYTGTGRLVCLVGPSGHGKSTLLSLLLGMYTHYSNAATTAVHGADTAATEEQEDEQYGGDLPFTATSAAPQVPHILLTLALPHSPPLSGDELDSCSSRGVSPTSAVAQAVWQAVHEQLSVASIPRDILRGNLFSFVPQSPVIFSGATIAHNISLENYVSLEQEDLLAEIAQCAAWAHCEYIQRFPQGLMTYIVDSGTGAWSSPLAAAATGGGGAGGGGGVVRLSGGQAQRLMMARALFHGRRGGTVLVMDEPTASLDKEVKLEILAEWRELLDRGIVRGMICATHDDDLIAVADEVVRLP